MKEKWGKSKERMGGEKREAHGMHMEKGKKEWVEEVTHGKRKS